VDAALATQAYEDTSLPIGHGQTISKPSVVARMIELLFDGANARRAGNLGAVLEIGTGCGYQAALLADLAQRVVSVERLKPLHDDAEPRPGRRPHGDAARGRDDERGRDARARARGAHSRAAEARGRPGARRLLHRQARRHPDPDRPRHGPELEGPRSLEQPRE